MRERERKREFTVIERTAKRKGGRKIVIIQ